MNAMDTPEPQANGADGFSSEGSQPEQGERQRGLPERSDRDEANPREANPREVRLGFSFEARQRFFAETGRWVRKYCVLELPEPRRLSRGTRQALLDMDVSGSFLGGSIGLADLTAVKELDECAESEDGSGARRRPLRTRGQSGNQSGNQSGGNPARPLNPVLKELPPREYEAPEVLEESLEDAEEDSDSGGTPGWERVFADYAGRLSALRQDRQRLAESKALVLIEEAESALDGEQELPEATSEALDRAESYAGNLGAQTRERLKKTADLWRWRHQREKVARAEAARRQRQAEEERAARARERRDAEKRRWAEENGSRRLRRALSEGHGAELTYAAERLALEMPRYRLLRVADDGSHPAFDMHPEPSEAALSEAALHGGEVVLASYEALAASLSREEGEKLLERLSEEASGEEGGLENRQTLERAAKGMCEAVLVGSYLDLHPIVMVLGLTSPSVTEPAIPQISGGTQA